VSGAAQPILTTGATPFKLTRTPGGNFVLAESGTGANDGRVTLVSIWGDRFNLIGGLPSGLVPEGDAVGPTAVADAHATLYIVIGEGNIRGPLGPPPQFVPNPEGLDSPIFSSVIRARFDPVPDGIRTGFELTEADITALADGEELTLENAAGEHVTLLLLADFRDLAPDPVLSVRNANPFAAALVGSLTSDDLTELGFEGTPIPAANYFARLNPDTPIGRRIEERSALYVVDAGMNTITAVSASTGRSRVITRFPPLTNPLFPGLGAPVTDTVPTAIFARDDGTLLVSNLSGFPFAAGTAKVYSVNPASGEFTPLIEGLTTATDVIEVDGAIYVLEISTNFLMGAPGRLLRFESSTAMPTVVAGGLIGPTGLAYEPTRNEMLVTSTFTGVIYRIPLTP
jgi:hypothetical protein